MPRPDTAPVVPPGAGAVGAPPPGPAPAVVRAEPAPQAAPPPDLGAGAPAMPAGGFDPGAPPPPPDPAAEAQRFAAYAAPHLDALAAGPEGDRPASEFEPISTATQEAAGGPSSEGSTDFPLPPPEATSRPSERAFGAADGQSKVGLGGGLEGDGV